MLCGSANKIQTEAASSAGAPDARLAHSRYLAGLSDITVRKKLEQAVAVGAASLAEMTHDETGVGWNLALLEIGPHEVQHVPLFLGHCDMLFPPYFCRPILAPGARIGQIAFDVRLDRAHEKLLPCSVFLLQAACKTVKADASTST